MVRLFDLKTGSRRNYKPQMAFYALGLMQQYDEDKCEVHEVYSRTQDANVYVFTRDEAEKIVNGVAGLKRDPGRKETPCEYCGWCARRANCGALLKNARQLLYGNFDSEDMSKKLTAARRAADWASGVKRQAINEAKDGSVPSGYVLVSRTAGTKTIEYRMKKEK